MTCAWLPFLPMMPFEKCPSHQYQNSPDNSDRNGDFRRSFSMTDRRDVVCMNRISFLEIFHCPRTLFLERGVFRYPQGVEGEAMADIGHRSFAPDCSRLSLRVGSHSGAIRLLPLRAVYSPSIKDRITHEYNVATGTSYNSRAEVGRSSRE